MNDDCSEFALTYSLEGSPRERVLEGERLLIGRAKDCDLCFPFNSEISRLHATLVADSNGWVVEDMASRSGTYVNDQQISEPRRLRDRDVLTIGRIKLTLREKKHGAETVDAEEFERLAGQIPSTSVAQDDGQTGTGSAVNGSQTAAIPREPSSPSTAPADKSDHYELIGVDRFESDVDKINAAARARLAQLRDASGSENRAEMDAVTDAVVCLTNKQRKREYDEQLAGSLGIEFDLYGGRVVPKEKVGLPQIVLGIVCLGLIVLFLWFTIPRLLDLLAPLFDPENLI